MALDSSGITPNSVETVISTVILLVILVENIDARACTLKPDDALLQSAFVTPSRTPRRPLFAFVQPELASVPDAAPEFPLASLLCSS